MRKFTALALAVVMTLLTVFTALPVIAAGNEAADDLFDAMKKGENVTLTEDVDLSDYAWTTISEYSGTLNGAGYTITVPSSVPFIEKLSGTIKNVTFVGFQNFDQNDVSTKAVRTDVKFGGIGSIANYAWGATIDNVDSYINTVVMSTAGFNYGGLVGNAWPAYEVDTVITVDPETDAEVTTYVYKNVRNNNFTNCTVYGSAYLSSAAGVKNAIGGLVGMISTNTLIDQCAVYSVIMQNNSGGQLGGLVGAVYADDNKTEKDATPSPNNSNFNATITVATVQNSLFGGSYYGYGKVDQSAPLVGYARGINLKNCFANGVWNNVNGGGTRHLLAYSNVSSNHQLTTVDGCASVADVYSGTGYIYDLGYPRGSASVVKNCLYFGDSTKISTATGDANQPTITNNTKLADADAVEEKFVELNSEFFAFDDHGRVKLARDNSNLDLDTIDSADDLLKLIPGKEYALVADIDLAGTGIGYLPFVDSILEGNGYTITLDGKPLFLVASRSYINGLTLEGTVNVAAPQEAYVGALACSATEIELCYVTNNTDVTVTYSVTKGGKIGGIIGNVSVYLSADSVFNYGTVTLAHTAKDGKASPDVGGIFGAWSIISTSGDSYLQYSINYGDIVHFGDNGTNGGGNVGGLAGRVQGNGTPSHDDDVLVYQCANKGDITGKITGERAGGLFGYHRDENIDLCYNTGKMLLISENTTYPHSRRFALTGYTNTGNKAAAQSSSITNSYVAVYETVESCFGNGNAGGSTLSGNFIPEGAIDTKNANWGETGKYVASTTYTDADDLLAKLFANEATEPYFAQDDCGINNGYPVFTWELHVDEHEFVTLYEEGGKNYVTNGKDLACGTYDTATFSGFIQIAENNSSLARIVMAINEEDLENETIDNFDLVIEVTDDAGETKSLTINSEDLIAYVQVGAAGETFYADHCQIFGVVIDFGDFEPAEIAVSIMVDGELWYYGCENPWVV